MKIDPHFIQPRHMKIAPPQAGISDLLIYTRSLPRQNAVSRKQRGKAARRREYPYSIF
jgi:hypothetical protein